MDTITTRPIIHRTNGGHSQTEIKRDDIHWLIKERSQSDVGLAPTLHVATRHTC